MGKQINYYMDYDSFLIVAQKALDLGCEIIRENLFRGTVERSRSIDIVTREGRNYYFHIPEAGHAEVTTMFGKERLITGYTASGISIIEAGYSFISTEESFIRPARLFCITDYYDEKGLLIKRPECVTKVYNTLVRCVKKVAPYTEIERYVINPMYQGEKFETKEYITLKCLSLVLHQNYTLTQ